MSADNVITVLETPRAAGGGSEYRVAYHFDSGCPLELVCTEHDSDGEPTKWESRLETEDGWEMGWVVSLFGRSAVYTDQKSAGDAAFKLYDTYCIVEYGVQWHRLPMSFEEMVREAPLERWRARHRRRHRRKRKA